MRPFRTFERFVRPGPLRRQPSWPRGLHDAWLLHFRNQTLRARRELLRMKARWLCEMDTRDYQHQCIDRAVKQREKYRAELLALRERLGG